MDPSEFDLELKELETRMERLRALYEQYFMGIERIEPAVPRKDVERRVYVLRRVQHRNTAKRFKLQTLIQRFNTMQQHWAKICRQMENGTYTRHLARAEKRFGANAVRRTKRGLDVAAKEQDKETAQQAAAKAADEAQRALAQELEAAAPVEGAVKPGPRAPSPATFDRPHAGTERPSKSGSAAPKAKLPAPPRAKPKAVPRPKPSALPPQTRAGSEPTPPVRRPRALRDAAKSEGARGKPSAEQQVGLSDARVRTLYGELLQTKKKLNQSSKLSEAALAKSLRASEARLRNKHAGRNIDFKVAVRDGKVVVKPVFK